MVETLKKRTDIGGDVKETDKYCGGVKETDKLKKQTNIGGDVKETEKYSWRR